MKSAATADFTGEVARLARGSCLCGAVNFTLRLPSKWVAHCHCTRCQRAHGAALVTWVGAAADQVSIDDGQAALRWFEGPGGSRRGLCAHCGSSLFFCADRWPGEMHMARANFIDALDREPQLHAYFDTHVSWLAHADALPTADDPDV
jgi:hypothetical protein